MADANQRDGDSIERASENAWLSIDATGSALQVKGPFCESTRMAQAV